MKVIYRNVTEDLLCIWVYENDGETFVCSIDVKKSPSGSRRVNVYKARS
ncbi:MAG: hypothetical protein QXJ40_02245 [Candidatus Bathyarchaeia archaeon]